MKKKKIAYGVMFMLIIIGGIFILYSNGVRYTNEFVYLPKYKSMKADTYQPIQENQFGNAVYTLKKVKYENFLANYEKVLLKDGWQVTQDKKPESIEVTKGEHIARINAVNSKDYITILIWTK